MWPRRLIQPPEPSRDARKIHDAAAKRKAGPPEVQDQYEDLLNTVWETEARERMNDRIDAAAAIEAASERHKRPRKKAK